MLKKIGKPKAGQNIPLKYLEGRFEQQDGIYHGYLNIVRTPGTDQCYSCHTAQADIDRGGFWQLDRDVHLRAGFTCANCHRNGIDHATVRGYEKEGQEKNDASVASLSCAGCHMGVDGAKSAPAKQGGRMGAPRPEHRGIPAVHFERLSCTTCHAGPWPDQIQRVQTAFAHALGYSLPNREAGALPSIIQPVFLKSGEKITPHRMMWPNFWGRLVGKDVKPILPQDVKDAAEDALPEVRERTAATSKPLTDEQITKVLTALTDAKKPAPVYISGGKLYRLNGKQLTSEEHPAAQPYAWPMAHDVRPAKQALGARGCGDCHATDSPIYFANVTPPGPATGGQAKAMHQLRGEDRLLPYLFAESFMFRPMLKCISFTCSALLAAVLALYAFKGLATLLARGRNS